MRSLQPMLQRGPHSCQVMQARDTRSRSQSGPHTDGQVLQAKQAIRSGAQLADTQVHVQSQPVTRSAAVTPY